METIDSQKAAQVWKRVHGETTGNGPEDGLSELIAQEWEAATTYLQLSRRLQGRQNMLVRKLFEQEQAHAACLKGIYTLITGKRPNVAGVKPVVDDPAKVLRRCYGKQMQCLAKYEQRSADPDYGHIYTRLAQQEKEHCHMILEILGSLK